ncbi:MAG: ABC-2 type transport system ATP-binding protein [Candidatus Paceibacteria bacterium]|jgi:ABC-2 type transport system ATP-binding protein
MSLLSIRNLTKTYANGTVALDQVTLEVPKGLFGLLGPNGAGKSTLMRTIATLQRPDTGKVQFEDIDVLNDPHAMRCVLGYLPQEFGVYPRVGAETLLNHLATLKGITNKAERKESVQTLLQQTNLWEVRKKAVAGFSGGMRQRFGVAQALLGSPRLLIVDEPTAGLDPAERQRFLDLICEVGERVAVIFSTHLVDDVRELCPNMAIMNGGRVLMTGKPEERIASIQGQVWSRACSREELDRLRGEHRVISSKRRAGQIQVHVLASEAPSEFDAVQPDLEDVYFAALASTEPATSPLS